MNNKIHSPPNSPTEWFSILKRAPKGITESHKRLGILGSSFNPIHNAHLALCKYAQKDFNLDEVLFVLPLVLPHKPIIGATMEQRLDMLSLAVKNYEHFSLGTSRIGLFYEICNGIRKFYQEPELYLITGKDAGERILHWDYGDNGAILDEMMNGLHLIVADRDGEFQFPNTELRNKFSERVHKWKIPESYSSISSTRVRENCRQGIPISDFVPPAVETYIKEHNLYKDSTAKM